MLMRKWPCIDHLHLHRPLHQVVQSFDIVQDPLFVDTAVMQTALCQKAEVNNPLTPLMAPSGSLCSNSSSSHVAGKSFMDVILTQQVKHNIRALAASAANTRLHGAPFRHYLRYGMAHCCLHKRPQYLLCGTAQLCLHNKNSIITLSAIKDNKDKVL
jgi:hypothetical protein